MKLMQTTQPNLFKDEDNGAILNKDESGLEAYKRKKAQLRKGQELEKRVRSLEQEVNQLKETVNKLVLSQTQTQI